ncbi:hypothetical protein [Sphingomonas profundi]|uniref:hypothetical protein n=1 Tax=Alterirhizorhabdus profundi TaxID=2681549 RepID=UPI0012E79B85|nr:hypothetical protein [Sphingomonas profundi]
MKSGMWSHTQKAKDARSIEDVTRRQLTAARLKMTEALRLLDDFSQSSAAASLDLAIHQLDRELTALPTKLS